MGAGPFSSDNKVKASDERQTAGDASINQRGGAGAFGEGSLAVSAGGKKSRIGDVFAPGASQLNLERGASITTADPDVLRSALSAYGQQNADFTSALSGLANQQDRNLAAVLTSQAASQANAQESQSGLLSQFTDALGGLTASQQTGGDSDRNKIILYVVLGLLAVVALIFWKGR